MTIGNFVYQALATQPNWELAGVRSLLFAAVTGIVVECIVNKKLDK